MKALEEGPLERLFGSAVAQILDFLVTFKQFDYSMSDIAENSGVSFRTVLREFPYLEKLGIIKHTRNVGRAKMYKLNEASPIAKALEELAFRIAEKEAEELTEKQKAKVPA